MEVSITDLPPVETMSEAQLRGAVCVFCGGTTVPGDVVDLGSRSVDAHGSSASWFPRRHLRCSAAHEAAYKLLLAHVDTCNGCLLSGCETGDELRRAVKAARR